MIGDFAQSIGEIATIGGTYFSWEIIGFAAMLGLSIGWLRKLK